MTSLMFPDKKHIASVSFGKDSLAMLLILIANKKPLDEVVFYNTGKEFKAIYDTRDKVLPLLKDNSIKYTELYPDMPFDYVAFEKPVSGRNGAHLGYSWCGGTCRWGTTAKLKALKQHIGDNIYYVAIAADEQCRILKNQHPNRRLPLVDWGLTEKDTLQYCYSKGYEWIENGYRLYDLLDRVSCFCCSNKNIKELRNIYTYLPEYWQRLLKMQERTNRPIKYNYTVFDLQEKFRSENQ